jgi:hypothetical protein
MSHIFEVDADCQTACYANGNRIAAVSQADIDRARFAVN